MIPHFIGIMFCRVFYETMANEWIRIDRLRLDKFYMVSGQRLGMAHNNHYLVYKKILV